MTTCLECNTEFTPYDNRSKFCNHSCSAKSSNRKRKEDGWVMSDEVKARISLKLSGRVGPPNPLKGVHLVERIKVACLCCGKEIEHTIAVPKKYCSNKCWRQKAGGYREGSGKSKSGYFKGIYCGSTYELAWVIYRLDHQLQVSRFDGFILYGDNRKYYPDFVEGKHIYEMKGWNTAKTNPILLAKNKACIEQGYTISVLFKEDLQVEFDWVKASYKYKEMQELYDSYKPRFMYSCSNCNIEFGSEKVKKTEVKFCSQHCAGKGHKGRNVKGINGYTLCDTKQNISIV